MALAGSNASIAALEGYASLEHIDDAVIIAEDTTPRVGLSPLEKLAATVVYTSISLLCLFGNGMVIFVLLFFKRMRRLKMNQLVLNLAVSDLMMGLGCIFFTYYPMLIHYPAVYPWPPAVCRLTGYLQMVCVLVSSSTLVVICIDRYLAIVHPLNTDVQLTNMGALYCIAGTWCVSALVCSPVIAVLDVHEGGCYERWGDIPVVGLVGNYVFSTGFVLMQFFVPLAFIIVTYALICRDLLRSSSRRRRQRHSHALIMMKVMTTVAQSNASDAHAAAETRAAEEDSGVGAEEHVPANGVSVYVDPPAPVDERTEAFRKVQMLPTLIIVSASYAICWLPLNTLSNILIPVGLISLDEHEAINRFLRAFWLLHTVAMAQSFINPIIYYFRSRRFNRCVHMVISGDIFSRRRRSLHRRLLLMT